MKNQDLTGKTVYYADEDCTYEVLVEKEHMGVIEGVVLWEESHYAPATYPRSMIPTLRHVTVDLYHDENINENSIRIYDRSEETLKKVEEIRQKQIEFKQNMVNIPDHSGRIQFFQKATITPEENPNLVAKYKIELQNIVGFEDGNPYIVRNELHVKNCEDVQGVFDTYASCDGCFLPDTQIFIDLKQDSKAFSCKFEELDTKKEEILEPLEHEACVFLEELLTFFQEKAYYSNHQTLS